jgi:hypothetical protein
MAPFFRGRAAAGPKGQARNPAEETCSLGRRVEDQARRFAAPALPLRRHALPLEPGPPLAIAQP